MTQDTRARSIALLPLFIVLALSGCTSGVEERPVSPALSAAQAHDKLWQDLHRLTVEQRLSRMSLRQKIGQRFMIYVPRDFRSSGSGDYRSLVKAGAPAGMIIYPWNHDSPADLRALTVKLQELAWYNPIGGSLLISADQEGGRVAAYRFREMVRLPSAAIISGQAQQQSGSGDLPDLPYLESIAYITGHDLKSLGINMNLAPVLDLTAVPDRSIIGDRSWGDDPWLVSQLGESYITGLTAAGVIATVKHFPGHGVTRVDSHGRLPVVDYTLTELQERDLLPFRQAIMAEVPAVMTAHILFPQIDPEFPVTISEVFLRQLLREQWDYDGVVISDGLSMGALADNYDLDTVLERALRLDVDIILLHDRYDYRDVMRRVEALLAAERITLDDIERGTRRVLQLKARFGLLDAQLP